ncbi:MAG: hypothetical protein MI784_14125 [Cytophagales bacterium]|nr:hypothetical protein [Cytophagales bacterium]
MAYQYFSKQTTKFNRTQSSPGLSQKQEVKSGVELMKFHDKSVNPFYGIDPKRDNAQNSLRTSVIPDSISFKTYAANFTFRNIPSCTAQGTNR